MIYGHFVLPVSKVDEEMIVRFGDHRKRTIVWQLKWRVVHVLANQHEMGLQEAFWNITAAFSMC